MKKHPHDPLGEDVVARQRNTIWPDAVRNAARVDGFILKGNPRASKVQRAGILIFGLGFALAACGFLSLILNHPPERADVALAVLSSGSGYLGYKLVRNAFLH